MVLTSSREDYVTNLKRTSTTRVPLATKLGRMVTYLDGLLPIKSHDPMIRWSFELTWHTKIIMSPITNCLWLPNVAGLWLNLRSSYPCYLGLWSRGLARSRDKLKSQCLHYHNDYTHQTWQDFNLPCVGRSREKLKILYLHYHNFYSHKAWQDDDWPWESPIQNFTLPFDLVTN